MTGNGRDDRRHGHDNVDTAKNSPASDGAMVAWLSEPLKLDLKTESSKKLPRETGGVLVGHRTSDGFFITGATGPGPKAVLTRSRFRRDGTYTQEEVDRLFVESAGREDYLGEWHSHPAPMGPSPKDHASMEWISKNRDYARPEPLLVIVQRALSLEWRLLAFVCRDGLLVPIAVQFVGNA